MARPQNSLEDKLEAKEFPTIITNPNESVSMVMSPDEYREYSLKNGRIMGRLPNQVTFPTEEEMRVLINSGYTRAMITEKHGVNNEQIDRLLVSMSNKERRDKVVFLA